MIIESIELKNYRNYDELHMDFNQGTNILYGDNAQGKTNILEAIYVCCTTKSHRGSKDREMIQFERDESHIKLTIRKNDVPYRIYTYGDVSSNMNSMDANGKIQASVIVTNTGWWLSSPSA